ncbi:Exosome complex component rrp42 [Friedmanniomyces endolithicus]|nr:Exosome complex component rrp42 [Friedmanniomyces endolithicus]
MAPYTGIPLSPAELQYLHTSLSQDPPIRPDGRSPTQFRPLVAETDILPSTNGSARICFPDGTEAMVGVKAEVEKTREGGQNVKGEVDGKTGKDEEMGDDSNRSARSGRGWGEWVEIGIEIPGIRDDDALPIFLSAMLTEALLADAGLKDTLWINTRFHWRLYIDILLLSQPLSYPLPLLSLTTHLALLSTRLPSLISERDEDPLFNDDWEASTHLYPRSKADGSSAQRPPITLLVMSVAPDELAVADAVVALSVTSTSTTDADALPLKLVALRTLDPPSRLTAGGVPNVLSTTSTTGTASTGTTGTGGVLAIREKDQGQSVWRPPRGEFKRAVVGRMIKAVVEKGGVGMEFMAGLAGVET